MGLMRSLFAGTSGLRNHQTMIDVIGNNIANINTVGFKLGRVSFSETFAQTLRGTTQPLSNIGGTNPIQVGLGMSLSTIDTLFIQGNIETTGQVTDLAIEGDGFFVLSDGQKRYYTRAGSFQFDGNGHLINPANGLKVQGKMANEDGEIPASASITDIVLPLGQKMKAKPTSTIEMAGNLDASLEPDGTVLRTDSLYAIESYADDSDIEGLLAVGIANESITGMVYNSTTVTVDDGLGNARTYTYVEDDTTVGNGSFNSLADLIDEINNDFGAAGSNTLLAAFATDGSIQFASTAGAVLNISSSNPILEDAFQSANGDLSGGPRSTDQFSHVATENDLLVNLRDAQGNSLGLQAGDEITIDGLVGDNAIPSYAMSVTAASTYGDYANAIETAFSLTNADGVQIDPNDGALIIHGDGGTAYELSALNIVADDTPGAGGTARTIFNGLFDSSPNNYDEVQRARDIQQSASVTVYDSLGNQHNLTLVFTKDVKAPNRWTWEAVLPEPAVITGGATGQVEFNNDGSLKKFSYADGSSTLQFNPGSGGANLVSIDLNAGEIGSFNGLTQMSGAGASLIIRDQDGYGMGELERIAIGEDGSITGSFSNGVIKLLGQVMLATFNNPGGLLRTKDNLFVTSANSGTPVIATAGNGVRASIHSGALEQSNVDLAEEFTKLIVAQRGFQANARVITTSDDLLSEVTNLKR
ncbi:MAG: flagellar hook protein FlgE [Calditrichia bacterium]